MAIYREYTENTKIGATPASTLVQSTGDAMNNIFDVLIKFPWGEDAGAEGSYRCEGFNPPTPKTKTYDVTWHGIKVKRIAAGIQFDRDLTLKFRVDGNYAFYRKLVMWHNYTIDVNTGAVANQRIGGGNGLSNDAEILVIAPGQEYNTAMFEEMYFKTENRNNSTGDSQLLNAGGFKGNLIAWKYNQAQLYQLAQPTFKNSDGGDTMSVEAKILFGDCIYPFFQDPGNPN